MLLGIKRMFGFGEKSISEKRGDAFAEYNRMQTAVMERMHDDFPLGQPVRFCGIDMTVTGYRNFRPRLCVPGVYAAEIPPGVIAHYKGGDGIVHTIVFGQILLLSVIKFSFKNELQKRR